MINGCNQKLPIFIFSLAIIRSVGEKRRSTPVYFALLWSVAAFIWQSLERLSACCPSSTLNVTIQRRGWQGRQYMLFSKSDCCVSLLTSSPHAHTTHFFLLCVAARSASPKLDWCQRRVQHCTLTDNSSTGALGFPSPFLRVLTPSVPYPSHAASHSSHLVSSPSAFFCLSLNAIPLLSSLLQPCQFGTGQSFCSPGQRGKREEVQVKEKGRGKQERKVWLWGYRRKRGKTMVTAGEGLGNI